MTCYKLSVVHCPSASTFWGPKGTDGLCLAPYSRCVVCSPDACFVLTARETFMEFIRAQFLSIVKTCSIVLC